jgi:DNA-directed RNA polymerase subunit alpha
VLRYHRELNTIKSIAIKSSKVNFLLFEAEETLGELVAFNKNDLLKFRNFGKKSLTELEELVASKNLQFGMNVAKYKLDKD